jgi:hypothetical protein|tara:strand:- start:296 stop:499 length:204 start_codon:yes stop_codon:yes gene_type:complete
MLKHRKWWRRRRSSPHGSIRAILGGVEYPTQTAAQGAGIQDTDATENAAAEVGEITVAARKKTAVNS